MRPKPIFDTNIFRLAQNGTIPQSDWQYLLRHRPGHGWPLSAVTALELLAGFQKMPPEKFPAQKAQIELACQLSKERILEEPRFLICAEVLRVPFPAKLPRLPVEALADHLHIVRCAQSLADILNGRVPVQRLRTKGLGHPGFSGFPSSLVHDLVAGPKDTWKKSIEDLASINYPAWRQHFQRTGRRLPEDLRKDLEVRLQDPTERVKFVKSFLLWLGGSMEPTSATKTAKRLDAVVEFTFYILREFLLGDYNLEKHNSDVYDQFQLHYLAIDKFVLVSGDSDMATRTARSSQKDRILTFEAFLRRL